MCSNSVNRLLLRSERIATNRAQLAGAAGLGGDGRSRGNHQMTSARVGAVRPNLAFSPPVLLQLAVVALLNSEHFATNAIAVFRTDAQHSRHYYKMDIVYTTLEYAELEYSLH